MNVKRIMVPLAPRVVGTAACPVLTVRGRG